MVAQLNDSNKSLISRLYLDAFLILYIKTCHSISASPYTSKNKIIKIQKKYAFFVSYSAIGPTVFDALKSTDFNDVKKSDQGYHISVTYYFFRRFEDIISIRSTVSLVGVYNVASDNIIYVFTHTLHLYVYIFSHTL